MLRQKSSVDNQLKHIFNLLEKLLNENHLFQNQFSQIDTRYQQWINNERIHLHKRIEMLENENHQLSDLYFTYQVQNEKSLAAIINLILQILSTQQELRQQSIEQHYVDDSGQWRKKRQQNTRSSSCQFVTNQWDVNRYTNNDRSIWLDEQDQQTTNSSSLEYNNHSSTLATTKPKHDKPSPPAALSNKIYYVLNNERTTAAAAAATSKPTRDNHRSTGIPRIPVGDTNRIANCKQQSSVTLKKNQLQTSSITSNQQRLTTQTSNRPSSSVKNTSTKTTTTTTSKPRIPTLTIHNNRTRPPPQKTSKIPSSSSNADRPAHPRYVPPKPSESSVRSAGTTVRSRPGKQAIPSKSNISPTKNTRSSIPIVSSTRTRVTDLDAVIAEREKHRTIKSSDQSSSIIPSTVIQSSLFSKDNVKHIRTIRSEELKLFSCHLTTDIPVPTPESGSTLTPSSYANPDIMQQINDDTHPSSHISDGVRDFSEDSLNEHNHIQKLLQQNPISIDQGNAQITIEPAYSFSSMDDFDPPYAPTSSVVKDKANPSFVHRLVFPERLNRLIFYRRTLSDSDIYQKNCSKDQEIIHHVYHLDTIRDYSMEYYMLTTYASDSQLRAWLDGDDEEIDNHFNGNRCLSSEEDIHSNSRTRRITSSENLIQEEEEELDWCSELQLISLSKENTFTETPPRQLYPIVHQTSTEFNSTSFDNQRHSTPIQSDLSDSSNILREILNHSWPDQISNSNSIEQEPGIEQFEDDSTSSIITDEFQRDFYYLCPINKTTSFVRTDSKI